MRKYPALTELPTSRDVIEIFGGYNHNTGIAENEFYDMKNLTSSHYPVLSTREKRGTYMSDVLENSDKQNEYIVATAYKDSLYVVTQSYNKNKYYLNIYKGKTHIAFFETEYGRGYDRYVVSIGSYITVFPDGVYVNVNESSDNGSIGASYKSEDAEIKIDLCNADGELYNPDAVSTTEPQPSVIKDGYLWLDRSTHPNTLKKYSSATGMWSSVATTYARIECAGIGVKFKDGDAVRISGIGSSPWSDINTTSDKVASIIQKCTEDYIVVVATVDTPNGVITYSQQESPIAVSRVVPKMDYVIESNNRLWGCRYGENVNGDIVNEIYASKLGDFKNWEYFAGTSQDSYVASLGKDGRFTGAISYMGTPLFFRQNCIHTIYGNYPAQYQLQTTECSGVQISGMRSLAVVDGVLYYKSPNGVCAYTGSMPTEIGVPLGDYNFNYRTCCAAGYRHKYYLRLIDLGENLFNNLFVYDTQKNMWHREDEFKGSCFCSATLPSGQECLFYLDDHVEGITLIYSIKTIEVNALSPPDDESVDWFAESGIIRYSSPDKTYISRMSLKLSMEVGTRVYVYLEYDSSGTWEQVGVITGTSLNTFTLPIKPRRCDHMRLKLVGTGATKLYSISKTMEQGSDI